MDFSNRDVQHAQPQTATHVAHAAVAGNPGPDPGGSKKGRRKAAGDKGEWLRIANMLLVFAVVVLIGAVTALIILANNPKPEDSYINKSKLQAVFLNTGQVYFGNITALNNKYFVLTHIYYLQTSGSSTATTTAANTSVSLVKLGCELHEPYDQMVINRDQVTFWENLQSSGQVATAVANFEKANPQGQKCVDQSNSSSSTSGSSVQSAGNSSDGSTSTTPAATKP
jgi:hypothetical protein